MNYNDFYKTISKTPFQESISELEEKINNNFCIERYPQIIEWKNTYDKMPLLNPNEINLKSEIKVDGDYRKSDLENLLKSFCPWRKGPFNIYDIKIDSEWRSDWKWNRLINKITPLKDKNILDIGCGNGYHLWRMMGEEAKLAIGIDPQPLFIFQFFVIKKLIGKFHNCWALPLTFEEFPQTKSFFDTCFSMGVIYHRKNPIDHLRSINKILNTNGELILESIILDSKKEKMIIPKDRYGKMNNVWFIPSIQTVIDWLKKSKFKNINILDVTKTTVEEQRSTNWMTFESLPDFLDKSNPNLTVEGYPAPVRAIFSAQKK